MTEKKSFCEESATNSDSAETCEAFVNLVACLEKFISSLHDKPGSCKMLAKAFPKFFESNPEAVQVASDQLWELFKQEFRQHVFDLVNELELKKRLCQLSTAPIQDDGIPWRSSGDPEKDMEAPLASVQHDEVVALKQMLEKENAEIATLEEQLVAKEAKVKEMLEAVEGMVQHMEEAASLSSKNAGRLLRSMLLQTNNG